MNAWTQRRRSARASSSGVILPRKASAPGIAASAAAASAALTHSASGASACRAARRSGSTGGWMTNFMVSTPIDLAIWNPSSGPIPVAVRQVSDQVLGHARCAVGREGGRAGPQGEGPVQEALEAELGERPGRGRDAAAPGRAGPGRAPGARRSRSEADRSAACRRPSPRTPCRSRPWPRSRRPRPPGRRRSTPSAGTTCRFASGPDRRRVEPDEVDPPVAQPSRAGPSRGSPARSGRRRNRPAGRPGPARAARAARRARSRPGVTTIPTSITGAMPAIGRAGSARKIAVAWR